MHSINDFQMYPHAESNRNRQNRNLKFYPLNYEGSSIHIFAKIVIFDDFATYLPFIRLWGKTCGTPRTLLLFLQ